ncbi:NAD(P)H-dependent oxidoreductase [Campylobacter geochelonis]|uniref:Nitroreductase family protein n=1 Tax=Campylobacter geochelonis TaxID=1780362 RepID=A0A128EL44_9BACT|nr:NAD(P)H-dependent oxidoreductase [Campylobacter geochelonis]QKF72017.1 nitroreductase family protein [Campylobacter geochelonis]CZE45726.1 nitroreductase family protein [Campylobacter geochelonis]CZE46900.1 nitroreductase family protein [Campylobacter geochelonis]CZE49897.1 nitroreductase family protein [Campylobacter geochelonis]
MTFKESLNFRHACKVFDENRKISEAEFAQILEAGRLSPSSLGLEHWDFWLVQNPKMREKIQKACWNQVQIPTCSHLLVIFAKISDFKSGGEYVRQMVERRFDKNSAQHDAYIAKIEDFLVHNVGQSDLEIFAWSKAQCFLCAQNMMSMAAVLGIDTCPIEGYVESELNKALELDTSKKRVAMLLPFGYRVNEPKPKVRRNLDEFLTVFE